MNNKTRISCPECKGRSKVVVGKTNEKKAICRCCNNSGTVDKCGVYGIPEAFRFYRKGYQHDKKGYVWKERNFRRQGLYLIYHKHINEYRICDQQFQTIGRFTAAGETLLMFLCNPLFTKSNNYRLPHYFRKALDINKVHEPLQTVTTFLEDGISHDDNGSTFKILQDLIEVSYRQGFETFIKEQYRH